MQIASTSFRAEIQRFQEIHLNELLFFLFTIIESN